MGGITNLYLDREKGELYILDDSKRQVVITDTDGRFLYDFSYSNITEDPVVDIAVAPEGDIYLASGKRILIFNYRGEFKGELSLSIGEASIQSLSVDKKGNLYVGVGKELLILDKEGKHVFDLRKDESFSNTISVDVDEKGIAFLDPSIFSVFLFDREGRFLKRFGKVSSLAGGFSMPAGLAIDRKNDRIIVVDANRWMVIAFDRDGRYLFEFGGPTMFRWPRRVVTDKEGRIYVADGTMKVRVFEVMRE